MIVKILKERYSARHFSDKEISKDILEYIFEAGRLSPSGGNEQSWMFGVIDDKEIIEDISNIAYNQSWIKTSPLLIVLCTRIVKDEDGCRDIQMKRFPRYKDLIENMDKDIYMYLNMEEHQTKIPGTHMILAAMEHGIYTTWISYFDVEKLARHLDLPSDIVPSEIIAFGYPDREEAKREKKSMEEVVFYNKYK